LLRRLDDAERSHGIPWVDGRSATIANGGRERAVERRIVAWDRGDRACIVADAQASPPGRRFRPPSGRPRIEPGAQGILLHIEAVFYECAVTAEQRNEARDVARREKSLAAEMTKDRRQQEALAKPAQAGSLSAPRPAATAPAPAANKHAKKRAKKAATDPERDFVATVPKTKKSGS